MMDLNRIWSFEEFQPRAKATADDTGQQKAGEPGTQQQSAVVVEDEAGSATGTRAVEDTGRSARGQQGEVNTEQPKAQSDETKRQEPPAAEGPTLQQRTGRRGRNEGEPRAPRVGEKVAGIQAIQVYGYADGRMAYGVNDPASFTSLVEAARSSNGRIRISMSCISVNRLKKSRKSSWVR